MNIDILQPTLPHSDGRDQYERPRDAAGTTCGRLPLVPVTDELEALKRLIDDDARPLRRFAAVWRDRLPLVAIRARARFHTDEIGRLLGQVREGQITATAEVLSCLRPRASSATTSFAG